MDEAVKLNSDLKKEYENQLKLCGHSYLNRTGSVERLPMPV